MASFDPLNVGEPEFSSTAFTVLKQKLDFDFSFSPRLVKGKTTIEIQPHGSHLKAIQLNCKQLKITSVRVGRVDATHQCHYSNLYERLALHPWTGIQQHHFVKARMERHANGSEVELEIDIPKRCAVTTMNPDDATVDQVAMSNLGSLGDTLYAPITVVIDYVLEDFRDALHFVGVEDGDARYPHVYTRNSPFPGIASSLFPCVDDGVTKCVFEISVRYPRTLGDAYAKPSAGSATTNAVTHTDDSPKADSVMSDVDDDPAEFTEEEKALEMSVICSGELTDDISDPIDPARKTASFTCAVPVLPQHIGIVIGPFEHVDLSDYRDTLDDERLGSNAIRVHGFSLPGKAEEVRNSAMMLAKALDSFTERYQSYPFEKAFKLAFVDDLDCDVAHSASFSICSSRLLFPEVVWEPLEATTRTLVHAVASQWIGVNVIPQRPCDHWVIVAGSWFMTEIYMRDLFGRNDYKFQQKMHTDQIIALDVRRPSLFALGEYLQVDPGEAEFMILKAPLVLSILHNRLVKQSGKNGVDRCLYRLLFNARNEKLPNGIVSTEAFLDICEKVGHQKLDTFFAQWIYGSGCPTFECHPVFNKKKQVIQLTIKQTQADPLSKLEERAISSDEVLREAKERSFGYRHSNEWPAFVGPMTIRIHEADGTPYEHIVDINSSVVKVEIPYNTKYKRLKRNRLQKERAAAAQGLDAIGETQEDVTFYMLGDLFTSQEEIDDWRISDWSPEDETRMDLESYNWIRVDADFEWICKANINDMPAYMYVAQLQQDKDVVAQAESIQWLALKEGHPLISSILVKTLMDHRYFHGIRTMAAEVMANSAKETLDWIGLFHLEKSFRELFCISESPMTRSNDFSDRGSYIIQCAIPRAIAKIKGPDGKAPMRVKRFLLDIMRYNDNRGNEYSDDHYIANLMICLAQSLTATKRGGGESDPTLSLVDEAEEYDFTRKAIEELGRHQRLDEWIPTYQNVYTTTALECGLTLMRSRAVPVRPSEFLQYTRIGNADNVRLKAWYCLLEVGGIRQSATLKLLMHEIHSDPSPHFRATLIRIFENALGQIAIGDEFIVEKSIQPKLDGLVIQQEETLPDREAELARRKVEGAVRALKAELSTNEALKISLEDALRSTTTSARDVAELLQVASMFYLAVSTLPVKLMYPRYWRVSHIGEGKLRFSKTNRVRSTPMQPLPSAQKDPKEKTSFKIKLAPPAQPPNSAAEKPVTQLKRAFTNPPVPKLSIAFPPLGSPSPMPAAEAKKSFALPPKPKVSTSPPAVVQVPDSQTQTLSPVQSQIKSEVSSQASSQTLPHPTTQKVSQKTTEKASQKTIEKSSQKTMEKAIHKKAEKSSQQASQKTTLPPSQPQPQASSQGQETPKSATPKAATPKAATPKPATPKITAKAKPQAAPKIHIKPSKKSRIIHLRLRSEVLEKFPRGESQTQLQPPSQPKGPKLSLGFKRKADEVGDGERSLKRQASGDPPMANGHAGVKGQVSGAAAGGTSKRKSLIVRLNVGAHNLPPE